MLDISVIILASGSGSRLGGSIPKQYIDYKGKPLLEWSLEFFNENESVKEIILVLSEAYVDSIDNYIDLGKYSKVKKIVAGAATRQISSYNGLNKVSSKYVFIHDAARPNLNKEMITRLSTCLLSYCAVVPCIPSSNTIYELNSEGVVEKVLNRDRLGVVQTPQAFRTQTIKEAHAKAKLENKTDFTDDAGMVLYYNLAQVKTVLGDENNIKVTYRCDIE